MTLHFTKSAALLKHLYNYAFTESLPHFKAWAVSASDIFGCSSPTFRLYSSYSINQQTQKLTCAASCWPRTPYCSCFTVPSREFSSRAGASWFQRRRKTRNYDVVGLGEVSDPRQVLEHIRKPEYADSGVTKETEPEIEIKTEEQIKCMRESCVLAKTILDEVGKYVKVGVTTDELDRIVHSACISFGAYPSPLNYRGFPKSVCTSVNNVACHGIPDNRPLKDGDIVSIDVSVFYNGYHGDCAATYGVGTVDARGQNLMDVAQQCLGEGVKVCHPGQLFCQIGKTISEYAESNGFTVVPAFCGHGIGSYFHGPPNVYHIPNDDETVMKEGMIFTIEPVISEGGPDIVVLEDGWTAVTEDNSRCAQYEHTILITKNGAEILTVLREEN